MKKFLAILACIAMLCCMAAVAEEEFFEEAGIDVTASLEEAAALYPGEVPGFTAPEGFTLTEVIVDDFGLTAMYASDAATFEFSVYDYGIMEGVTRYSLADGALSPVSTNVVDIYEEEGEITSADIYTAKGAIYFYFTGMDQAAVEAVLAGLDL